MSCPRRAKSASVCHAVTAVRPFPADHTGYERPLCTQCHEPALAEAGEAQPVTATPIPHTLEGRRDQCLTCHGEDGFKPYPADHVRRTPETCLLCHVEGGTALAGTEGGTTGAPATPADHVGREDLCLNCHQPGGGVAPSPADHDGREVGVCLSCHVLAEEDQATEVSATPTPESETEEAHEAESESEEADEGESGSDSRTSIPHSLEGRDDCLLCHNLNGVKPSPADHELRTPVMCQACHQPE
jgi:hypothetical protein